MMGPSAQRDAEGLCECVCDRNTVKVPAAVSADYKVGWEPRAAW